MKPDRARQPSHGRPGHLRCLASSLIALTCLIGASMPTFAQDAVKSAHEKWRPKDGPYAVDGENISQRCEDAPEFDLVLRDGKVLSGESWACKISKLTETGPNALRLNLACEAPEARKFREVMTLRKIDDTSVFVRMTDNGKFRAPDQRAVYCSKVKEGRSNEQQNQR